MQTLHIGWQVLALIILLLCSGFFSIAETSLMAINRHRVRHLAKRGNKAAQIVLWLLERTDRLLGMILIGNTLINAAITALVTALAIQSFGNNETVITLATGVVAFLIIVFSEITPKVVGAAYPERIALPAARLLKPLMAISKPIVWFVNLFVAAILKLLRINTQAGGHSERLSPEELRSMVLEQSQFIAHKPRTILNNLFDLDDVAVDDIMTARAQIEALDVAQPLTQIKEQLTTCYHNKLPVYADDINNIKGILHVRKALALLREPDFSVADLLALLTEPYYVPAGVGAFKQLQFFQENRQRIALVVDEYGEVEGLITLEDIIEELVGEFTTSLPGTSDALKWKDHQVVVDGQTPLRYLNRRLNLNLPLGEAKTLNGLVLEALREIPDAPVALAFEGCVVEVVFTQNQVIKRARLIKRT